MFRNYYAQDSVIKREDNDSSDTCNREKCVPTASIVDDDAAQIFDSSKHIFDFVALFINISVIFDRYFLSFSICKE